MTRDTQTQLLWTNGHLFNLNRREYFSPGIVNEDIRVNIYDEYLSMIAWTMHALTMNKTCKGILILGGEIYNPWELTLEIREKFAMPLFYGNHMRIAS